MLLAGAIVIFVDTGAKQRKHNICIGLPHKLKVQADGPYGYAPKGSVFDRRVTQAMAESDFLQFLAMDPVLSEGAVECGLRSFQIMTGALDGLAVEAKLLSYEDVTGVGYGVAVFAVTGPDGNRRFEAQCESMERTCLAEKKVSEDHWVKLTQWSSETFVKTGKRLRRFYPGSLILSIGSFGSLSKAYILSQSYSS